MTELIAFFSAVFRIGALMQAAGKVIAFFTKKRDPETAVLEEVNDVQRKELDVEARPDRPLGDVLDRL